MEDMAGMRDHVRMQEVMQTIRAVCQAHDHASLGAEFRIMPREDGGIRIYRQPTDSENEDLLIDVPDDIAAARHLAGEVALDLVRQHRRMRTLREEGGHHANPAWSLTLTRTMAGALTAAGSDPRTAGIMGIRKQHCGEHVVTIHYHHGSGLHYSTKLEIRTGSATMTLIGGRTLSIALVGRDVPDTLLSAIAGHPVAGVVAHPFLEGSTAIVRVAERRDKEIVLMLDDEFVPAAPPPPGIDVSWLGLGRTL